MGRKLVIWSLCLLAVFANAIGSSAAVSNKQSNEDTVKVVNGSTGEEVTYNVGD